MDAVGNVSGTDSDETFQSTDSAGNSSGESKSGGALVDELERDLTLVGVVGLRDPLRPEVKESVAACKKAGITVKMLTGDNAMTAMHIAKDCGILPSSY